MAETITRTPFDPAPVVADVLHLLAHPEELRDGSELSMCGACVGSGRLRNPNSGRDECCLACHGERVR